MKKSVSLLLVMFAIVLPFVGSVTAAERVPDQRARDLYQQLKVEGKNAGKLWKKLSKDDQTIVLDYLQPDWYKEGKQGELIFIESTSEVTQTSVPFTTRGYYIQNPRRCCETTTAGPSVRGKGGTNAQLTLEQSGTVSNTWSGGAEVSASVVSASVGFDVTKSQSIIYRYTVDVLQGQTWQIDARNVFDVHLYDLWYSDWFTSPYKVKTGRADNFKRVDYIAWRVY